MSSRQCKPNQGVWVGLRRADDGLPGLETSLSWSEGGFCTASTGSRLKIFGSALGNAVATHSVTLLEEL